MDIKAKHFAPAVHSRERGTPVIGGGHPYMGVTVRHVSGGGDTSGGGDMSVVGNINIRAAGKVTTSQRAINNLH